MQKTIRIDLEVEKIEVIRKAGQILGLSFDEAVNAILSEESVKLASTLEGWPSVELVKEAK